MADAFAVNGYLCVLPDLFNGDQVSIADYDAKAIDIGAWISRHTVEDVASIVEATIKYLRTNLDVQNVAAAGYCFGGKVILTFISETLSTCERAALISCFHSSEVCCPVPQGRTAGLRLHRSSVIRHKRGIGRDSEASLHLCCRYHLPPGPFPITLLAVAQ